MSIDRAMWAVAILLVTGWGAVAAESPAERYKSLETAIPEGIRLLEAKEYATFLKNFVPPEHFQRITNSVSLDEFARKFGEDRAEVMLAVLKAIREEKPTLDDGGTRATYTLKEPVNRKGSIVWEKVDDHWYIRN